MRMIWNLASDFGVASVIKLTISVSRIPLTRKCGYAQGCVRIYVLDTVI